MFYFKLLKNFIGIILVSILAWILVHITALFGVFVALAYPLFWMVNKEMTPAILHWHKGKKVNSLSEATKNALALFGMSVLSIGLVFVESRVMFQVGFPSSEKTAYFNIPSRDQYKLNQIIPLEMKVGGIEKPINAIQVDVAFDPNMLEVVDVNTENSFASIFVQRELDNEKGYLRINGGLPNPGFSGPDGVFATTYFRAKNAGVTTVEFLPTSMILANDGYGTNVMKDYSEVSYFILPEQASGEQAMLPVIQKNTAVLGETTSKGERLEFFDANLRVLGDESSETEEKINPVKTILGKIMEFDRLVLSFWSSWMNNLREIFV